MIRRRLGRRPGRRLHGTKLFQRLKLREVGGRVGRRGRFRLADCIRDLFGQVLLFHFDMFGRGRGERLSIVDT